MCDILMTLYRHYPSLVSPLRLSIRSFFHYTVNLTSSDIGSTHGSELRLDMMTPT
jgi:hypothetical protein